VLRRPLFFFEEDGAGGGAASTTLVTEPAATTTAAAGVPAAAPGWVTDDGTLGEGWLAKLPEEIRANPSLKVMGSLADLAKSYVSTKALVGKKLEMPGEGATPEALTEWRKVVGAPEKPEGYIPEGAKSIRPDTIPEGMWDAKAEQEFLSIAHKHSLPPGAVKEIMAYYGQHMAGAITASAQAETASLQVEGQKLKESWGKDYDSNLAKSTSPLARDYRGENGPERQAQAQAQLHELMTAQKAK
jgi:hypothetical protein